MKNGYGTYKYGNGDTFEGNFANGLKQGNGIYRWSTGEVYDGEWNNDLMDGMGHINDRNGNMRKVQFRMNQAE